MDSPQENPLSLLQGREARAVQQCRKKNLISQTNWFLKNSEKRAKFRKNVGSLLMNLGYPSLIPVFAYEHWINYSEKDNSSSPVLFLGILAVALYGKFLYGKHMDILIKIADARERALEKGKVNIDAQYNAALKNPD